MTSIRRASTFSELAVLWGTSAAAVVAMFLQPLPLVFLLVPLTGWCASRFTTFTAALHACALGTVALVLTADGHGPIARLARRHLPGDEQRALASLVDLLDHPTRPSAWRRPELGPGDVVVPLADGGEMVLAVTSRPLAAGRLGTLLVVREVTAHRSGFRPLVEFASTAAHDLRGPLTTMRSWLSLAEHDLDGTGRDDTRDAIRRVDRSVVHMSDLIDDLLAQAAAEGGHLRPEAVVLGGSRRLLAELVGLVGLVGLIVAPVDLPAVHADRGAVRQLFANLLGNCAKYARPGIPPLVEVHAHARGDRVVIEVRDHGIGVPEADRERVFDRFHRSEEVQASYVGTGLGLSLCRTIVERHGGRIVCAAPDEGPGTVFCLDLPAVARESLGGAQG